MATFPEDLRSFLIASTSIADALGTTENVYYNHTPQQTTRPFIWFRTSSDTVPRTMDRVGGIHDAFFDFEIVAQKESTVQDLADMVHAKLDGYQGTVTNSSAQGMFLTAKDDSYIPRTINDDDGRNVVAYDLEVWYST